MSTEPAPAPETRNGLPILPFANEAALQSWIDRQPSDPSGLWLKLAKKESGIASVTKAEAVDTGLCNGWIDGLINAYDASCYLLRFTPRRPKSKWSEINVQRAEVLIAQGRMRAGGLREIEAAKADGRWAAAYPPASRIAVPDDLQAALDANPVAAAFFATLKGPNRYAILYRLHDVRDPDRRVQAIGKWVEMLTRGATVY